MLDTTIIAAMNRQSAAQALLALIKSDWMLDIKTRFAIAYALGCMGTEVAPLLVEALGDPNEVIRHCAGMALRVQSRHTATPTPVLKEALKHPDENIRLGAAIAILQTSNSTAQSAC